MPVSMVGTVPTIVIDGYKFRFYSSDINEPPHMHVIRDGNEAKVWLQPVSVEYNYGYNESELNRIVKLTRRHRGRLLQRWHEHFAQ